MLITVGAQGLTIKGIVQTHTPEGAMILLQIAMVSPGTHLVKNHESLSTTSESQLKRTNLKLKMLGPLCNQTVNLKTDSKTLYHSILKLYYILQIHKFRSINGSLCPIGCMPSIILRLWGFLCVNYCQLCRMKR